MDPEGTLRCPVCGQAAADEARFCPRCGARLPRLLDGKFRPRETAAQRDPPKGERR